ncbi:uncharacterized protein LOC110038898 [Phalaenopsis equestris]|uniref:uncharacterized protein LOC110038898 n=1 Tax=Phalaenopsis equestris TaxID=78828 RepID=UPI0009E2366F|nr:uncharacterized protein LOC110038898 [Phalaenopsis equestris]
MWRAARFGRFRRSEIRRLSTAASRHLEDEGHWYYSPEWWGDGGAEGHTVFRSISEHGNGTVSVTAYPSSRPAREEWPVVEGWLQGRYAKIHPEINPHDEFFRVLGYQWRVLRFNDDTRQSTVKIMAAYREADPASLYLMQQPHCLAVPYLKSMVSGGLTALSSSGFDISNTVNGHATMSVLCIGHGGGSLPLFLASKIKGAIIDIVEIDPVVISASIVAMGFPASATVEQFDKTSIPQPSDADKLLWGKLYNQLQLYRSDAENFIIHSSKMYDLIFIDAYDGDDIFPRKLWVSDGPFLKSLQSRLHPVHGTVVVNLHADSDVIASGISDSNVLESVLPMGKYVTQVCKAYKENLGFAFIFSVPWLCNLTLVASNGVGLGRVYEGVSLNRDLVQNALVSHSNMIEYLLDLPFSCLPYIKRDFQLVD